MPVLHQHDNDSDAVKIAHEKEKTKRFTLYIGSIVVVAVFGIYFVFRASDNGGTRKVDVDFKGGKIGFSVDKPIVAQAGVATKAFETPNGTVQYTTGKVDASLLKGIEDTKGAFSSTAFTGENFINKDAGFLFSIDHPGNWEVIPNQSVEGASIVNNFVSTDGKKSNLNVVIGQLPREEGISEYVRDNVQGMISNGMINEQPSISYDVASNTAILVCQNLFTGGRTVQKFVLNGRKGYVATANISPLGADDQILADMYNMIASFTLISN